MYQLIHIGTADTIDETHATIADARRAAASTLWAARRHWRGRVSVIRRGRAWSIAGAGTMSGQLRLVAR